MVVVSDQCRVGGGCRTTVDASIVKQFTLVYVEALAFTVAAVAATKPASTR
jgi:hypothetical protein